MFTSILNEYVTVGRKLIDDLFSKSKFAGDEENKSVAEGQEVWEAATPMVVVGATWGVTYARVKIMLATISEAKLTSATKFLKTVTSVVLTTTTFEGSSGQDNSQLEDNLDMEIENIRILMMKVS